MRFFNSVRPLGKVSLFGILSALFVLQIVVAVGIIAYLSFRNGQITVNELAAKLQAESIARVHQHLDQYLSTPHLINQINLQAARQELLHLDDLEQASHYFWEQGRLFPGFGTIAFASAQGELAGANQPEQYIALATHPPAEGVVRRYTVNAQGYRDEMFLERTNYDPRTRLWYQTALAAARPAWSEIAISATAARLDLSAVAPYFDDGGQPQGVFFVDVSLQQISQFLSTLQVGTNGQIFIMDRQGNLVATSTPENLFVVTEAATGTVERLSAQRSQQPQVAAAATYLARHPLPQNTNTAAPLTFEFQGGRYFLQVIPYQDEYGLDWLTITVVPEKDFMGQIETNNRQTLWLSLVTLAVAVGLGLLTARWITHPILDLTAAARQVAQGQVAVTVKHTTRRDELGVLARTFNHMTSELHQLYGALKDSEQQLASIINFLPDPTFVVDTAGRVIAWNRAIETLTRIPATAIMGKAQYEYALPFYGERRPLLINLVLDVQQDIETMYTTFVRHADGSVRGETLVPALAGGPRYFFGTAAPLYDSHGQLTGAVESLRDITDHKHAEAEILTLNAELEARVHQRTLQLEAANKELEAFTYSVSHDLRAPLRAIDGFSRILLDDHTRELSAEGQSLLERVSANARRMGQLIDDLLAFSRLSRQPLSRKTVPTRDLVRETLAELLSEEPQRPIEVTLGDLPECQADPGLLKQVWFNLLSNALKYTRHRNPARIEVGSERQGAETVYFVRDNGAGFDMRYADKLYGVFQRLHRSEEFEGTGVGLATVQHILQRHGGRSWAKGEVDRGAVFYFVLNPPPAPEQANGAQDPLEPA